MLWLRQIKHLNYQICLILNATLISPFFFSQAAFNVKLIHTVAQEACKMVGNPALYICHVFIPHYVQQERLYLQRAGPYELRRRGGVFSYCHFRKLQQQLLPSTNIQTQCISNTSIPEYKKI